MDIDDLSLSDDFMYLMKDLTINGIDVDPQYFQSLIIKKDFYNGRFPVRILKMNIPYDLAYEIVKTLDITRPVVDAYFDLHFIDNSNDSGSIRLVHGDYIGLVDEAFLKYLPYIDKPEERREPSNDELMLRVALYRAEDINAFKHGYVNGVFKNFNLETMIMYGFKECINYPGDHNLKLLLSPPDNTINVERELMIPMGFYEFMKYLDDEFGIYDTDYLLFLDRDIDQGGKDEVFIMNKKNDHGIEGVPERFLDPINVFIDPPHDISHYDGVDLTEGLPPRHYKVKQSSLINQMNLEKFGRTEEYYSDIKDIKKDHFLVSTEDPFINFNKAPYEDVTSLNIKSNRYEKHKHKKHDVQKFVLKFNNLPFLAKPYTPIYLKGQGKGMNEKYRIMHYTSIFSSKESFTTIDLRRHKGE